MLEEIVKSLYGKVTKRTSQELLYSLIDDYNKMYVKKIRLIEIHKDGHEPAISSSIVGK